LLLGATSAPNLRKSFFSMQAEINKLGKLSLAFLTAELMQIIKTLRGQRVESDGVDITLIMRIIG
jgi:hypothetical protein